MTLAAGSRLGPYEIVAPLGAGGMGEVWRARDTRLKRAVAIKVLPEPFTWERERLARFEREAQVLASLNHPNIAAIYGLEDADGARALVMELVEGPTLAERLASGPLSVEESVGVARQIVAALAEAHDRGIVHRDLKPENVKCPPGGPVKVLDFGLAKVTPMSTSTAGPRRPVDHRRYLHDARRSSGHGGYMAPEQVRGEPVDACADLFALGCVLYEMLTGEGRSRHSFG